MNLHERLHGDGPIEVPINKKISTKRLIRLMEELARKNETLTLFV